MQTGTRDQYGAMSMISRNVLIHSFLNYTSVSLCTLQFSAEITFNTSPCTHKRTNARAHTHTFHLPCFVRETRPRARRLIQMSTGRVAVFRGQTDNQCVHNGSSEAGCDRIHPPLPYSSLPLDKSNILSPKRSSKYAKITRMSPRIISDIWNYAARKSPHWSYQYVAR